MTSWLVEADTAAVADAACHHIARAAAQAIAERGRFHMILAGGQTPLSAYHRLAMSDQQWPAWSLYYGDERCLPTDHPDRNNVMVAATGLSTQAGQHHPIPVEIGCEQAAAAYAGIIDRIERFDLVVLGVGEDGHTASLFPGHDWPEQSVFSIHESPKPPAERVTLGVRALQRSRAILVLVSGAGKSTAVAQWRAGAALPITQVTAGCETDVIIARDSLPASRQVAEAMETTNGS